MELVLASHNPHKVIEIQSILSKKIKILSLSELGLNEPIEETGQTLEENALIKARWVFEKTKKNVIADDSGLEVFALNKAPGVYSSRYAGEEGNSTKNIEKLLKELQQITDRRSRFRCCIALIFEGKEYLFEGTVYGRITYEPLGYFGFGYDPIFIPDGYDKTFAQMSAEEKNAISHRFQSIKKLVDFLENKVLNSS